MKREQKTRCRHPRDKRKKTLTMRPATEFLGFIITRFEVCTACKGRRPLGSCGLRWLNLRRRILPWCMRGGCWHRSLRVNGRRGNLCPVHAWQALERLIGMSDEEFDAT